MHAVDYAFSRHLPRQTHKHTHTIDIVAISKLYVNFTAHRSEHGVLSHCYPASKLERYDGPLACCVEGWKEELKVSLRAAAKLQAPWNKFTANSCRCTTGCSTKKCRCLRNGLCCSSHCHGRKCCTNQKHDEPNEKEDEPHRTRKREMESAKLRTLNEVSLLCLGLHDSDVKILEGQRWLNDRIVNVAQKLLRLQYPHIPGTCNCKMFVHCVHSVWARLFLCVLYE